MNDDEYNFDFTDKLSALFGMDSEAGNSSLTYKAPKHPGTVSTTSKTFHKYIKLYQNHTGKLYGKYIIAIVTLDSNLSEMLIYQTKNNIFIRQPVVGNLLYTYTNNKALILNANDQQFKLEFENKKDLLDFSREFIKNGGLLELFKEFNSSNYVIQKPSSEIDSLERSKGSADQSKNSNSAKNESSTIFTRLEKTQPLPLQIEKENTSNNENTINKDLQKKNENSVSRDAIPAISNERNFNTRKDNFLCPPINSQEQTNLFTSILLDSQTNNSELKKAINLLTSKLKEIIPCKESDDRAEVKKLESRIKALELRSENLQSELKNFHEKYTKQNGSKFVHEQKKEGSEIACQTDNLEYINNETIHLRSVVIQAIEIVKSLPFTPVEISKLKNWVDQIGDVQLKSNLQLYLNFIEEKSEIDTKSNITVLRNEFVSELKESMNKMYQNIGNSEENDFNNLLVKQIKLASSEILKSFDNLIQHTKK